MRPVDDPLRITMPGAGFFGLEDQPIVVGGAISLAAADSPFTQNVTVVATALRGTLSVPGPQTVSVTLWQSDADRSSITFFGPLADVQTALGVLELLPAEDANKVCNLSQC